MSTVLAVVQLESSSGEVRIFEAQKATVKAVGAPHVWDNRTAATTDRGVELLDIVAEEAIRACRTAGVNCEVIALTLPGTVVGLSQVALSTRLGIRSPLDVTGLMKQRHGLRCYVVHDTHAIAIGEMRHGIGTSVDGLQIGVGARGSETFAYVLVGEGIGTAQFMAGKPYHGAGAAGHLGRMIVDPGGSYNRVFASRGPLEVFASRPWVSQNLVGEFLSETDKRSAIEEDASGHKPFRAALAATVSSNNWSDVPYSQIASGIRHEDPIAIHVIDEAARYLGLGLSALITIANPPLVIIGGAMVWEIPTFFERTVTYARRYSWDLPWARTTLAPARLGPDAQFYGTAEVLREQVGF